MKKFVLKILLFLFIIIGLLFALSARWKSTQAYLLIDEKYFTANPPKSIDVINVGSSHGMTNFTYDSLPEGYTGFNFGRAVQTFEYDLRMIKQNKRNLDEGCVVFIPVSYFSFYQRYDDEVVKNFEYIYYNFLDPWYINDFSLKMGIEYKWFPILDIKKDQLKYLINDDTVIEEYDEIFQSNRLIDEATGNIDEERLLAERDKTVKQHTKYFDSGINDEAVAALEKMLSYCEKKGYKCILVTTPFSNIYNSAEQFDEEFFELFYGMINDISSEYDVPYWDYSHDEKYSADIYLFYDDDHLNRQGQKMFSSEVISRAFEEGYLK